MTEIDFENLAMAKVWSIPVAPVPLPDMHPDAALMAACAALDAAEREHLGYHHGPNAMEDDDERDEAMRPNEAERRRLVRLACCSRTLNSIRLRTRGLSTSMSACSKRLSATLPSMPVPGGQNNQSKGRPAD